MFRFTLGSLACVGLLLSVLGCGGPPKADNPPTFPTTATVTYNGEAVEGATVAFIPATPGSDARSASGTTDASGKAAMWTFEPGDGALPGSYGVTVTKMSDVPDSPDAETDPEGYEAYAANPPQAESLLPAKYGATATSGLTADVAEGPDNSITLELTD